MHTLRVWGFIDMIFYKQYGQLLAVYFECNKKLGKKPFFTTHACDDEWIVDMPYMQVVFTPCSVLRREAVDWASSNTLELGNTDERQYPDQQIFTSSAGAAEDRSRVPAAIRGLPFHYFRRRRLKPDPTCR